MVLVYEVMSRQNFQNSNILSTDRGFFDLGCNRQRVVGPTGLIAFGTWHTDGQGIHIVGDEFLAGYTV